MSCPTCAGMKLLDFTTVGKVLGVTRWTVADYVRRRGLRTVPIGRKGRKIPVWELKRWQQENLIAGNSEALKLALDGRRKKARSGREVASNGQ